ncbi:hypothetical protein AAES_63874 [Amazona aestiva]|uniref:Uncharacterized protein n=1 Tax=Amazona aestiva TaxID=12930 RepID=A0A0Q3PPR3_AMAAE|nr:hypothetical protein AAES_63874 [Amazona aestiva]
MPMNGTNQSCEEYMYPIRLVCANDREVECLYILSYLRNKLWHKPDHIGLCAVSGTSASTSGTRTGTLRIKPTRPTGRREQKPVGIGCCPGTRKSLVQKFGNLALLSKDLQSSQQRSTASAAASRDPSPVGPLQLFPPLPPSELPSRCERIDDHDNGLKEVQLHELLKKLEALEVRLDKVQEKSTPSPPGSPPNFPGFNVPPPFAPPVPLAGIGVGGQSGGALGTHLRGGKG